MGTKFDYDTYFPIMKHFRLICKEGKDLVLFLVLVRGLGGTRKLVRHVSDSNYAAELRLWYVQVPY